MKTITKAEKLINELESLKKSEANIIANILIKKREIENHKKWLISQGNILGS